MTRAISQNPLRLVSLYSGAGGLDYGFEAAGFETSVAVEMDRDCCITLRANRDWPVIERDIHEVPSAEILDVAGVNPGEVDILIGGPPCQPFSKAAYWTLGDTKRLADPRSDTLGAYMRCVADLKPKVFLLENVLGISYSGKEEGFQLLYKLAEQVNKSQGTNYKLSWKVISAADYGVPQLRTRFFMIGHRDGKSFDFPNPTHGAELEDALGQKGLFASKLHPFATAWDGIGDLEADIGGENLNLRGRWADLLASIPEGDNYLWHTNRKGGLPLFGWRTRYWSFLLKLAKNRPSWTIQAQPGPSIGPFHWKNRLLSAREMARLQTFPDDVNILGGRNSVQRQLGNAVPSLLAEVLARNIGQQYFGRAYSSLPKLAVRQRLPMPDAEPLLPVPSKFLNLIGDYPDHPGTGKGNLHSKWVKAEMVPS